MKRPQRIYWLTLIAWLVGVLIHLIWFVLQRRDQPSTDEVYTQLLSFQVAAFAVAALPYWLGALLIVLILEFSMFGHVKGRGSL